MTVHLIVGNVGAGKSTYAAKLAETEGAHILANDPWFRELYGPDAPAVDGYRWTLERTQRIERVILDEARHLDRLGLDTILDLGFFEKSQRDRVRANLSPLVVRTHVLEVDAAERWRRVEARNEACGATFAMHVDRKTFDFCETLYEPPEGDELNDAVRIGETGEMI